MSDNNIGNTGSDIRQEHETFLINMKKFLCIALAVVSFVGAGFSFYTLNCKYLEAFSGFEYDDNILPFIVYFIANVAAFVFLGIFGIIAAGAKTRQDRLKTARQNYRRTPGSYTDVSKERQTVREINRLESAEKTANVFMVLFGVLAGLLFVALFFTSGVPKTVIELSKKPIDRLNKDYRVILDLLSQFFFTVSVVFSLILIPKIAKGDKVNTVFAVIAFAFSVPAILHYAYFFFGNITAHASPEDLAVLLVPLILCGFIGVYFAGERRKKIIKGFSEGESLPKTD